MMTHPRVTSSPSNHRLSAVWRWRERYLHNARRFMVRALGMTVVVGVGACGGVDSTRAMDEPTQPSETPAAVYVAKTPEPSPEVPFEQGAASTAKPERETVAPRRSDERPPPDTASPRAAAAVDGDGTSTPASPPPGMPLCRDVGSSPRFTGVLPAPQLSPGGSMLVSDRSDQPKPSSESEPSNSHVRSHSIRRN